MYSIKVYISYHLVDYDLNLVQSKIETQEDRQLQRSTQEYLEEQFNSLNIYDLDIHDLTKSQQIPFWAWGPILVKSRSELPHLSDPYEPPQWAYRPLFEDGYLLISFQATMCKVLLSITYSNAYLLY